MNVAENLYDYLKHNDRAELIGFGTFYVKNTSARINDLTSTIEPPKRELFFTREQTDDRSFVSFMAQNEFISEDTAYTWIKQYADSLNEKLVSGRSFVLGKLGKLEKGLLEEYNFTVNPDLNLLEDSFALGMLSNVQTFDTQDEVVETIRTKTSTPQDIETPQQEVQSMPKEFEDKKEELQKQIEQAKQIKEESKINETQQQTEERIIQHSEAVVETTAQIPQEDQTEVKETKLNTDTLSEDKIEQTIERAEQFTQKVVVEDIKPAKAEEKVAEGEDELKKQAEEIVKKHSKNKQEIIKTKRYNKRSRRWKIFLFVIIALLLLCAAFVGAHRFGLLKDVGFLKPVTDRLSYYVPVAEKQSVQQPANAEEVAVETVTEESYTGEIAYEGGEPAEQEAANNVQPQTNQTVTQKALVANNRLQKKTQQTETSNQTAPTVKEEPIQEDNTPVVTQNYSKLGFDVVSGSFADKTKAEAQARKAKRLGYDGYVLAKIKSGTPVYYVSYGSRRTLSEANDLMQSMMNRLGGNYYVISR